MKLLPSAFRKQVTAAIRPLMRPFVASGLHPNVITTIGFLVTLGAGFAFFRGALQTGGALVLLGGFIDIVDGYVARESGKASAYGSFYDSTLDRLSEIVVLVGVMSLYSGGPPNIGAPWMVYVVGLALGGSLMVSYTRAKAEALGVDCKVGVMQRAERIILLGGATLLFGSWRNGLVLNWVMIAMAVLTNLTALYRIYWVWRATRPTPGDPASAEPSPVPESVHT